MYPSPKFPHPPWPIVNQFLQQQAQGKVLAAAPHQAPEATLIPYVFQSEPNIPDSGRVEVHLVQGDPTLDALKDSVRAAFLVDQPLSFIPHTVFDPLDGNRAMLLFRSVLLAGTLQISFATEDIAKGLERLIAHLEPNHPFAPVTPETYGERLGRLAHVTIHVDHVQAKWKLSQDQPPAVRQRMMDFLAGRDEPLDRVTAPILEEYWAMLGL